MRIGVDVDQYQSYRPRSMHPDKRREAPAPRSAEAIQQIAHKTAKGGNVIFNAANDGIGVAAFYDAASKLPADIQTKIDAALARHEGRLRRHLSARTRLREDPGPADRRLPTTR